MIAELSSMTDDQRMLADTVATFVERELKPHEDEVERLGEVPVDLVAQIKQRSRDMGLYAVNMPEEHGGGDGRLHHVTYATDQREDILRAADIFLQNGVHIETGPHKHAIQGTFFLYVWEPAGNRVELANAGARLILAPDWQPVKWTESDRKKGQAWGLKTIPSFHTHGTPPVKG